MNTESIDKGKVKENKIMIANGGQVDDTAADDGRGVPTCKSGANKTRNENLEEASDTFENSAASSPLESTTNYE